MLIKELILRDFRQFKGVQRISFSADKIQNVTIIIGENGTGKTTFAQAFTWCLYGTVVFDDKNLICKSTVLDMQPDEEKDVSVELKFIHNNIEYKCIRSQTYVKESNGDVKSKPNSKFIIEYRDQSGQQKFVPENQLDGEINKILPVELSNYFFFDGERIGSMSKDIAKGSSKEFPNAVKSLLGLAPFERALYHLNGSHNQSSVVKTYKKSFDASGNKELEGLISEISELEVQRDEAEARITEINEKNIPSIDLELKRIHAKQMEFESAQALLTDRSIFEKQVEGSERLLQMNRKDLLKYFSEESYNFFLKKMIVDVLKELSDADVKDKGIPDIHERTIQYLIKEGKCICGTAITSDSKEYHTLIDLLKYIPPQSLGTSIRNFTSIANEKMKKDGFVEFINDMYGRIRSNEEEIDKNNEQISDIDKKLAGISENDIDRLQSDYLYYSDLNEKCIEERGSCQQKIIRINEEINEKERQRNRYTNIDDANKKISKFLSYAEYIYKTLEEQYKNEERKVREEFENTINEIFNTIYNGGLSLKIDEMYNIKIFVRDYKDYSVNVETSTAQSLSVILAFISAVIKMARRNEEEMENRLLVTEAYPLVMDAPLSAFDTKRIKSICDVLPGIAEQLIIFINDKDGLIAEENMKERIGKKYSFNKVNEFETYMEDQNVR